MNKEKLEQFQEQLTEMRKTVGGDYARAVEDSTEEFGEQKLPDVTDEATRTMSRRLNLQISDKSHETLAHIDEALDRIAGGDYGLCDECGESIHEERLKLIPYALHCVECQEAIEKEAGQSG